MTDTPPTAPFPNDLREYLRGDVFRCYRGIELSAQAARKAEANDDREVHLTNLACWLRRLLRIADIAVDVPGVREAIAEFERDVPAIVNARDVLEHFDDYRMDRGRLQRRGTVREFFTFVAHDGTEAALNVAGTFQVSTEFQREAILLAVTVLKALRPGSPIAAKPR